MEKIEHDDLVEALPAAEVAGWRAEMYAKINEAISLGVFTDEEAAAWGAGFEACTEVDHMAGLVEIIDDFIDSGREVVGQIEALLAEDVFTDTERLRWRSEADWISFRGKQLLISKLSGLVVQVQRQRQQLVGWLSASRHIAPEVAKRLVEKFTVTEADNKEKILHDAVQLELKQTAEYRRLNQSTQQQIRRMIFAGELDSAERMLGAALPKIISQNEYVQLRDELDTAQIQAARQTLMIV